RQAVSHLKVGNGLDEATDIGPLVNEAGLEKVSAHVDDALRKGASSTWADTFSNPDRKSTRLNSSHVSISYAVFCLKKKNQHGSDDMGLGRQQSHQNKADRDEIRHQTHAHSVRLVHTTLADHNPIYETPHASRRNHV